MWSRIKFLAIAGFLSMLASNASAQALNNPNFVNWVQPDHNIVTKWELGYFAQGAQEPFWSAEIPKAAVSGTAPNFVYPLPKPVITTNIVAKMKSIGRDTINNVDLSSTWSDASNSFDLTPLRPVVTITK